MFLQIQRFLLAFLFIATVSFTAKPITLLAEWQLPPYQFPGAIGLPPVAVASDANGHAFTAFNDSTSNTVLASYYTSGAWGTPQVIGVGSPLDLAIAMDDSGTALVIWFDQTGGNILTANFDGSSWNNPSPSPLDTISGFSPGAGLAIDMNGPNEGVALWIDLSLQLVRTAFFSGGNWTTPTTIGIGVTNPTIGYSTNGTAVAGWSLTSARVSNYIGGSWQPQVILDTPAQSGARVGIDSNGNAHAIWLTDPNFNINFSNFNGTSWSAPQALTLTSGNRIPSIGVAPTGTAVATWVDSAQAGQSSAYNGSTWSAPFQFTTGPIINTSVFTNSLSVNNSGDAFTVWITTSSELKSARLKLSQAWAPEELITTLASLGRFRNSLSSDGTGFAAWSTSPNYTFFAGVNLSAVLPASSIEGAVCKTKFASQTDIINTITWTPSTDPRIQVYNLSRNGVLIAAIPASGPFIYRDHQRCSKRSYTYSLTAVSTSGVESTPISVTLID